MFGFEGVAPGSTTIRLIAHHPGGAEWGRDEVVVTVVDIKMDPVTSGTDPVPINPAIVAPVDVGLDDGTTFTQGDKFELTTVDPDIDFGSLGISLGDWYFVLTQGYIDPNVVLVVDPDLRGARLVFPLPSWGNLGAGRVVFAPAGREWASVDVLVRNIQPDLEPDDFRFMVKAHLCTDGQGISTSRTAAEIRSLMSDVTKVLSQCGIIVFTSQIVTTVVPTGLVDDLDIGLERAILFDYDEDETDIDVYFVVQIESGAQAGNTLAPFPSLATEAGVAIADQTVDGPLVGQEAVRTLAHEITHYLLNHWNSDDDHRTSFQNLMYPVTNDAKRDLDEGQCSEVRSNFGVD